MNNLVFCVVFSCTQCPLGKLGSGGAYFRDSLAHLSSILSPVLID